MALTVAVLGGTGNLGRLFVQQALEEGYSLRLLVRNPAKLAPANHERLEAVVGDATRAEDVARVVAGADVVVSCLGNASKLRVMDVAASHILTAARSRPNTPRCVFVSSVGCRGTSFVVKWMLIVIGTFMGLGKGSFDDYEAADTRILAGKEVPCVLVRPYALTDKTGTGAYHATENQNATFMRSIARADAARFVLDAVTDTKWDGKPGVQVGGPSSPRPRDRPSSDALPGLDSDELRQVARRAATGDDFVFV
ncbi:MAG: NAD(P)-dependent dehydrogenase (short-subunit alcohol dehydrogenase family) [Myxococcota bacterium]|jgi:NAD(P)-dependent dehydrogenase (short-subunit alcohol dehydrogenase family)